METCTDVDAPVEQVDSKMLRQIAFTYPFLVVAVMDVGRDGSLLKALTLISICPLDVVMVIDLVTL